MRTTIWFCCGLLWFCGILGCKEKNENFPVGDAVLPTSNALQLISGNATAEESNAENTVVFFCKSTAAKRYHLDPDCRGLKRCKHVIVESDKDDAVNRGLTMCGYEY